MQADEGVEHEQHGLQVGNRGLQLVAIVGDIEADAGRRDDVDRQIAQRHRRGPTDAPEARAHDMQGILGGIQQHRALLAGREATQTGRTARDGDEQVEGQEAFAALGLAADDADGLIGPQILDEPPPLGWTDGQLSGACDGQHGQRVRPGRGRGREEVEEELLIELWSLALGAGEEQFVRVPHQRAVIAAGVIDQRVEQARREQARVARLLEGMAQTLREIVARGGIEQELHAQATLEGDQLDFAQAGPASGGRPPGGR